MTTDQARFKKSKSLRTVARGEDVKAFLLGYADHHSHLVLDNENTTDVGHEIPGPSCNADVTTLWRRVSGR
jgi:hypothetical protein